ncbi:PAQR family membrane homeostasis protein TrhA [Calidifontibacter terrae]
MKQTGGPIERAQEDASALIARMKPKLRGWLHTGMFPTAMVAGLVLVMVAPTFRGRVGGFIFTLSAGLLFGISAVYHRGSWSPRTEGFLKRFDHSNIFLIIAGTYTPFALTLLPERRSIELLLTVWIGAFLGVVFRIFWVGAPRWLYVPIYLALGWVAVFFWGDLMTHGGTAICALLAAGGLCYTVGAVVYGTKRPNPSPTWFGFHEIFHALTLAGFTCHYIAAMLAVFKPTP